VVSFIKILKVQPFYSIVVETIYTNRVIIQWFKLPELLYGATVYGPKVDMWSVGCIFPELFTGRPVFQGQDEIHQLDAIFRSSLVPGAQPFDPS